LEASDDDDDDDNILLLQFFMLHVIHKQFSMDGRCMMLCFYQFLSNSSHHTSEWAESYVVQHVCVLYLFIEIESFPLLRHRHPPGRAKT